MPQNEEPEAFIPTLVETALEEPLNPLVSSPLQELYTRLSPAISLPFPEPQLFIPHAQTTGRRYRYLRSTLTGELQRALEKCIILGSATFKHVKVLYRERDERYKRLCPLTSESQPGRYEKHTRSIGFLRDWKGSYSVRPTSDQHFDPEYDNGNQGPALSATAKIPRFVMAIYCRRDAYEEWATEFHTSLNKLRNGLYAAYQNSKVEFENLLRRVKDGRSVYYPDYMLQELEMLWTENFLAQMRGWEETLGMMGLPSYLELAREVYLAVLEGVEGGEQWKEVMWAGC